MTLRSVFLPLVMLVCASPVVAQTGTGSVTGRVTCGDTQRPARFAAVTLFAIPADATSMPDLDKADPKNLSALMSTMFGGSNLVQAQTALDGTYTASSVPPGDYYVFASMSGYVSAMGIVQTAMDAGADMKKPLPGVQTVHVVAEHTSNVDVSMQRGAAVSGTVRWDDGSPVTGARVQVLSTKSDPKKMPLQFAMLAGINASSGGLTSLLSTTDDLGRFRLSGLAPGEYRVRVEMQTGNGLAMKNGKFDLSAAKAASPVIVYAPSALHSADAKLLKLNTGEEYGDTDVVVNLTGMHTVSGHVASAEDHHGINSGEVTLTDSKDKEFTRKAGLDAQGNFTVTFVPSGTYELAITDGADTEPSKKNTGLFASDHTVRSYEKGTMSVMVVDSDVTGQNLELVPSKKAKDDVDLNGILGGLSAPPPPPPPSGK